MTSKYVKGYEKALSELVVLKASFSSISEGVELAKSVVAPLYYQFEEQIRFTNGLYQEHEVIPYYEIQSALLRSYRKFKSYSDADWEQWIIKRFEKLKEHKYPYLRELWLEDDIRVVESHIMTVYA